MAVLNTEVARRKGANTRIPQADIILAASGVAGRRILRSQGVAWRSDRERFWGVGVFIWMATAPRDKGLCSGEPGNLWD